jgi:hypothetical protein
MGMRGSLCLVAGCGLFLSGCPSFTNLKTARGLDQGEFQFTAAPGVFVAALPAAAASPGESTTIPLPQLDLAARYGIVDGFDLGLKVWLGGVEIDSTISLLRGGFDLALAPGIGFFGIGASNGNDSGSIFEVPIYIPLLAGINVGYGHQFVFGVEAIPNIVFASASSSDSNGTSTASGTEVELFLGGTVGFSFKLGASFRIMPEVNVFVPLVAAAVSNGSGASQIGYSGTVIFQGALGFSFGGDGFNKHPSYVAAPPM